jgi:hypothetical protein
MRGRAVPDLSKLWLGWVAATVAGAWIARLVEFVGPLILGTMLEHLPRISRSLVLVPGLMLNLVALGFFAGLAQGVVMRSIGVEMRLWILATLAGGAICTVVLPFLAFGIPAHVGPGLSIAYLAAMFSFAGAAIGTMQRFVLARHFGRSAWWIPAMIAAHLPQDPPRRHDRRSHPDRRDQRGLPGLDREPSESVDARAIDRAQVGLTSARSDRADPSRRPIADLLTRMPGDLRARPSAAFELVRRFREGQDRPEFH